MNKSFPFVIIDECCISSGSTSSGMHYVLTVSAHYIINLRHSEFFGVLQLSHDIIAGGVVASCG